MPTEAEVAVAVASMKRRVNTHRYEARVFTLAGTETIQTDDGFKRSPCREVHVSFHKDDAMVFTIWALNLERVEAHWQAFLQSNGALAPKVGARVGVKTGPGREYRAKVLKVTKSRVLAEFKFGYGRMAKPRWFRLNEIWW
jgi:hypothetical protein